MQTDIKDQQKVIPRSRPAIHETIVKWFAQQKPGRVLDAPTGYGHLSMKLKELGFDVVAGDIEPEVFRVKDIDCIYTDLNRKIDAPDNSFDYVCCVDGLEHMTDPYRAVEEFSRVLKPGGIGVFSIPNYANIEKRLKFLLKGYLTGPKSVEDYEKAGKNLFNFHNSPLSITLLDTMFSIYGLNLEEIRRDAVKKKQKFLIPLVLLIKFIASTSSKNKQQKRRYDLTLKDEVILGGNTIICITKKI
ncbi:MAG: class I SAM-dependent methyltransferase [Methylophagaceae bacterium]